MQSLEIFDDVPVNLSVAISSDANVGTNVSLNDLVVRKSIQNTFSVNLGNLSEIENNMLSIVSNFFVQGGNIEAIMNATIVDVQLTIGGETQKYVAEKVKINSVLFMAYFVIKLLKK